MDFEIHPPAKLRVCGLFQRVIDGRELGTERAAEPVHDSDDREADASGNQTVLNGGCCGFVGPKL
jgi:hypothetical protein